MEIYGINKDYKIVLENLILITLLIVCSIKLANHQMSNQNEEGPISNYYNSNNQMKMLQFIKDRINIYNKIHSLFSMS